MIFGLGNPGPKYARTRHNLGFMVLDFLAAQYATPFKSGRGDYLFAEMQRDDKRVVLIKPGTFMNLSGSAVQQAMRFWKPPLEQVLVVYDELDLPFGRIRLRAGGSHGGHKGMRSILEALGTPDIPRLRIGIETEGRRQDAVDFVLGKFSKAEQQELPDVLQRAAQAVMSFVDLDILNAMNVVNTQSA